MTNSVGFAGGFRRPNIFYQISQEDMPAGSAAAAATDAALLDQFGPNCFNFSIAGYVKRPQGHVYQYICTIVLQVIQMSIEMGRQA
jgi:hypothetical protein